MEEDSCKRLNKFACCPMCAFCMGLFIHWRSGFCKEKLLARWDKKANCRSIISERLSCCLCAPVRRWLAGTLVWNQWNSGWLTWFMTHSGLGLIRCTQAPLSDAACVWMTIEDQQHYTPNFAPAFWTPQITSSLLIYGGHLESHTDRVALCHCSDRLVFNLANSVFMWTCS